MAISKLMRTAARAVTSYSGIKREPEIWWIVISPDCRFGRSAPRSAPDTDPHRSQTGSRRKHLKRAIELKPNYALAHNWYGIYLDRMAQGDEAFAEYMQAQQLDPASAVYAVNLG